MQERKLCPHPPSFGRTCLHQFYCRLEIITRLDHCFISKDQQFTEVGWVDLIWLWVEYFLTYLVHNHHPWYHTCTLVMLSIFLKYFHFEEKIQFQLQELSKILIFLILIFNLYILYKKKTWTVRGEAFAIIGMETSCNVLFVSSLCVHLAALRKHLIGK